MSHYDKAVSNRCPIKIVDARNYVCTIMLTNIYEKVARTGSQRQIPLGLSEIVRLVDILLRELMDACPVIPLFTDERIEQEVLMNLIGMKADLVIRASLTRRLGPIKQGIKENGIALRPQSFNPSSERRYDMADESSALD